MRWQERQTVRIELTRVFPFLFVEVVSFQGHQINPGDRPQDYPVTKLSVAKEEWKASQVTEKLPYSH